MKNHKKGYGMLKDKINKKEFIKWKKEFFSEEVQKILLIVQMEQQKKDVTGFIEVLGKKNYNKVKTMLLSEAHRDHRETLINQEQFHQIENQKKAAEKLVTFDKQWKKQMQDVVRDLKRLNK